MRFEDSHHRREYRVLNTLLNSKARGGCGARKSADKILEMAGIGGNSRYQAGIGGSVIGFVSVVSGFLSAYYRFWEESLSLLGRTRPPLLSAASTSFAKNFDVQITPNNTK
jgi:hypothetical protein